jgi:hypothetical protein
MEPLVSGAMRLRSTLLLLLLAAHLVLVASPVFATDVVAFTEGDTEAEEPEEQDEGSQLGIVPAVETPPVEADDSEQPWTQRFLAPTLMALGALGLAGSFLYYWVRIRGRYKLAG